MPNNKAIGAQAPGYYAEGKSDGVDERHPKSDAAKKERTKRQRRSKKEES